MTERKIMRTREVVMGRMADWKRKKLWLEPETCQM